jgi:hypothetical protein
VLPASPSCNPLVRAFSPAPGYHGHRRLGPPLSGAARRAPHGAQAPRACSPTSSATVNAPACTTTCSPAPNIMGKEEASGSPTSNSRHQSIPPPHARAAVRGRARVHGDRGTDRSLPSLNSCVLILAWIASSSKWPDESGLERCCYLSCCFFI